MKLSPVPRKALAGYSLLEANIATAMVGSFVAALMMMNANLLGVIKTAKEAISANQSLEQRVEQMRIANWAQITDANYVAANFLNAPTDSAVGLPGVTETMTVSAPANASLAPA